MQGSGLGHRSVTTVAIVRDIAIVVVSGHLVVVSLPAGVPRCADQRPRLAGKRCIHGCQR